MPTRRKFALAGYTLLPGYSYRNMWWVSHNPLGVFEGRGIHGQRLYIAPQAELVIARFCFSSDCLQRRQRSDNAAGIRGIESSADEGMTRVLRSSGRLAPFRKRPQRIDVVVDDVGMRVLLPAARGGLCVNRSRGRPCSSIE